MKKSIKMTAVVGMIIFQLVSIIQWSYAEDVKYIEQNGVLLADINSSKTNGVIHLIGSTEKSLIKALIVKGEDQEWLEIPLNKGKFDKEIWLTHGTGDYKISVMVNEGGRTYSFGPQISVENIKEVNRFLVPTKDVESDDPNIIKLAKEITKNKSTDMEKARAIYKWVVANIKYDYAKYAKHLNNDYNNKYGALNTFKTKTGVCYDYAVLTAALGRAIGIQVKVVSGTGRTQLFEGLHAWNEIYCSEEKKWINVDATFGNVCGKNFFNNVDFYLTHEKEKEY